VGRSAERKSLSPHFFCATVSSWTNSHPRRSALIPIAGKELSPACHRFLSSHETHNLIERPNKKLPRRCEGARVERGSRGNITCCSELGLKHSAIEVAVAPVLRRQRMRCAMERVFWCGVRESAACLSLSVARCGVPCSAMCHLFSREPTAPDSPR
jgi:hypothetical protein